MKFIKAAVDYVKGNPLQSAILIGLFVLLIAVIVIIAVKAKKNAKTKREAERIALAKKAEKKPQAATSKPILEMEKDEEKSAESVPAPIEMKNNAEKDLSIKEQEKEKPAIKNETKAEKVSSPSGRKTEVKSSASKATVSKASPSKTNNSTTSKNNKAKEGQMLIDELNDSLQEIDFYEEGEMDKIARYSGKWTICRVVTDDEGKDSEEMYFFELHASNGEKLLSSEEYTTYNGALRGIETHKTNILKDNFKITLSKKGDYIFKLLSGKNMLLCMGENYATKARCESAIESAKRFAKTAVIDENVQDHVVKVPVEDDSDILPPPDGYNGKWLISSQTAADGEQVFYFELFANNGEKLLSSEEYTTYIGAVNGIRTHKTNIDKNNFRISLTKRGDYIYKLLNGNGQLLCLGEHYKTKRLCLNAVESVKRFAMNSPVLTDSNTNK